VFENERIATSEGGPLRSLVWTASRSLEVEMAGQANMPFSNAYLVVSGILSATSL
jgi:hypothetical protein